MGSVKSFGRSLALEIKTFKLKNKDKNEKHKQRFNGNYTLVFQILDRGKIECI